MPNQVQTQQQSGMLAKLKTILNDDRMKQSFTNILSDNAGAFMASIIELYQSDATLRECDPNKIILEALKAATLKLSINKQIGFAYIVAYKNNGVPTPTMIIGYKGYIQLAQRTGQYKYINADAIYEGETASFDRVSGALTITGERKSDKAIGYFAYFQLLNGFEKCIYWTRDKVTEHAKAKSKSWRNANSPWHTDFDAMALKTMLRNLLSKYGVMSVEYMNAIAEDRDDTGDGDAALFENSEDLPINGEFVDQPAQDAPASTPDPALDLAGAPRPDWANN
jgi:recombination protein RecT